MNKQKMLTKITILGLGNLFSFVTVTGSRDLYLGGFEASDLQINTDISPHINVHCIVLHNDFILKAAALSDWFYFLILLSVHLARKL